MHLEVAVLEDERGQRIIRVMVDQKCLSRAPLKIFCASG